MPVELKKPVDVASSFCGGVVFDGHDFRQKIPQSWSGYLRDLRLTERLFRHKTKIATPNNDQKPHGGQ